MKSKILLLLYVIIGFVIASTDPFVMPVYLTILPFHGFLLYQSVRTKNILFILFCFLTFMSYGIGSIVFYLDREHANSVGFDAIGSFDFSYSRLFEAYSYLAVFMLVLWGVVLIGKKRYHSNFLPTFIKEQYYKISRTTARTWSIFPILIAVVLFSAISVWMYSLHIGMIGLHQTELPYHLTGILFYSRRFIFPLVLVWFFLKTRDKFTASILLIFYSLIVGVLATSKSAALLVLIPITYLNYVMGKKGMFYVCAIASVVVYVLVGGVRTVIYQADAEIDALDLLSLSYDFYSGDGSFFLFIVKNITGRLYGLQSTVLGEQYTNLSFSGLFDYYTHAHILEVVPDYVKTLFGIDLPEDKAYGVALGYTGTMQILSCHNPLYTILQSIIIGIIFCIQNDCVQKVVRLNGQTIYKYAMILLVLYSFLQFYDGSRILPVYLETLLAVFLCRITTRKSCERRVMARNAVI